MTINRFCIFLSVTKDGEFFPLISDDPNLVIARALVPIRKAISA